MASETTNINIRMDRQLKEQAEKLFSELGLNMTTAFNIFLRQAVRQNSIPFEITLNTPNDRTIAAMEEAELLSRNPEARKYASFADLLKEVEADV